MNAGIYIRLSEEDKFKKENESESIKNQRFFLLNYAKEKNINVINEYVDDGYSGLNYNRPRFNSMIDDIKNGIINCVITKDFSRLGRENSQFLFYVENFFPENNIRYISVNDNYDSDFNSDNDIVPFKSVFNDFYCKDISKKIRSSLYSKMKCGQYIGSKPCYGYKKDPNNKNKLIIDKYPSIIVKRIFADYVNGKNMSQIARELTEQKIDIPSIYNKKCIGKKPIYNIWKAQTIKYILTNQIYIGDMVQGKVQNISYKVKKRKIKDKKNWFIVEGTHEPIVDKETFSIVQKKIKSNVKYSKHTELLLIGLVKCKECGTALGSISTTNNKHYFNCKTYLLNHRMACYSHSINYEQLENIVFDDLKHELNKKIINYDKINNSLNKKKNKITNEITSLNKNILELKRKKEILYSDRLNNILTIEEYIETKKKIDDRIKVENENLENLKIELEDCNNNFSYNNLVDSLLKLENPNKALLNLLIEKIEINKNKEIEISYNFC